MKYPFLIPFIFLSVGIILKEFLSIEIPLIFLFIFLLITFITKRELSVIALSVVSLILGIVINEKIPNNIKDAKNINLQCIVIDIPSVYKHQVKFNCKVINSDYKDILNKNLKITLFSKKSEKLDIFLFSNLNLNGNLKVYKNSLNFYSFKYKVDNSSNPFINLLHLKKSLKEKFREKVKDKNLYSIGEALIFGDRGNIDNETKKIFINSGLIHLLAISGLHVGMLITILLLIFYPLKKDLRYTLVALLVSVFPFLTGLKIPVVRASLMGILFLIGKIKNFRVNSLNILFFVATAILILSPKSLFSPSFQLSFIAVLGILIFVEKHNLEINNIYQYFYIGVLVSIVATIFTTPVLTYHFGKFSPVSVLATPIGLIPLYPYTALAVINLLTGFQFQFLVDLMNKFGEIFVGITAIFGNLDIFYIGYKPVLIFTALILVYFILIFISNFNIFIKLLTSISILGIFLYFSKTDKLTQPSDYKIVKDKKFILLKLPNTNECYLYMKRRHNFIETILNKENCIKRYLIIIPNRKIKSSINFDRYIPINTKINNIQFIKVGKDINIKLNDKIIYP